MAAVTWEGIAWDGPAAVDGDNLVVTNGTAHYNTSTDFRDRGTAITFSFIDEGPDKPRPAVWIEDEASPAGAWFGATSSNDYLAQYIDFTTAPMTNVTKTLNVGRAAGEHTITLGLRPDGQLDYWLDGSLLYTAPNFGMDYIGDVYLYGSGGSVTYTAYAEVDDYSVPTDKAQCKDGDWMSFSFLDFRNQGQCASFVATH